MTLIVSVLDSIDLLPMFLKYYTRIGVTRFIFVVWNGDRNPLWAELKKYPVELVPGAIMERKDYNGIIESAVLTEVVRRDTLIKPSDWICVVDLDEFVDVVLDLQSVIVIAEGMGYNGVRGTLADRVARDYTFPEVIPDSKLDDLFPMESILTYNAGGNWNKVCLARAAIPIGPGHHSIDQPVLHLSAEVQHFKWRKGILERLRERSEYYKAQNLPWAGESEKLLRLLETKRYLDDAVYEPRLAVKIGV